MTQDSVTQEQPGPGESVRWPAIGLITGVIGLIFVCCPYGVSIIAPILLPLGLGILASTVLASMGRSTRGAGWLSVFAITGGLGVVAVSLAAGGFLTRHFDRGDYLRYVGTRAEATILPAQCSWINQSRRGLSNTLGCHGASWTVDGRTQTGSMELRGSDLPDLSTSTAPVKVIGYAKGDAAVSLSRAKKNYSAARVGVVPLWVGGAGLVLVLAALVGVQAGAGADS